MTHPIVRGALCAALLTPVAVFAANDADIAELRSILNQMKNQYERRIADLESRLERAERAAPQPSTAGRPTPCRRPSPCPPRWSTRPLPAPKPGGFGALTSGNAFNPQISVILDGNYYQDGIDGEGSDPGGRGLPARAAQVPICMRRVDAASAHDHGAEDGHAHGAMMQNGFNFRSAEIAFSATVDPYFDATFPIWPSTATGTWGSGGSLFPHPLAALRTQGQGRQVPERFRICQPTAPPPVGLRGPEPALSEPTR
jgi:hypothetical protein